jgi:hypothetical protein
LDLIPVGTPKIVTGVWIGLLTNKRNCANKGA